MLLLKLMTQKILLGSDNNIYKWLNNSYLLMIPIRCFTCGKPIAHKYEEYKRLLEQGVKPKEALDKVSLNRYCCRGLFTGHLELFDKTAVYKEF